MKDWTSRLSKWWWWFEIFFGLHEWPLLKKKKVGYFKRLGPFKRCYNLQLVNIFCDHFMQSFVTSCSCTLRLNQCIKKKYLNDVGNLYLANRYSTFRFGFFVSKLLMAVARCVEQNVRPSKSKYSDETWNKVNGIVAYLKKKERI
jgi:hypothetical protein